MWFTCDVEGNVDAADGETPPASSDSDDPTLTRLSELVARRRNELGLSQRSLAGLAGISLGTVNRFERGAGTPRVSTVPKFEDALEWPRGTFQTIREGGDPPNIPPQTRRSTSDRPEVPVVAPATAMHSANQYAQALSIGSAVVAISATCLEVLTSELPDPVMRVEALNDLDARMRQLESLVAASLPDAESFDDAMAFLREVHQSRQSIQKAAEALS
ncbi:MAG: helix-turn-helix domain-containing protein [Actinomycetia bacterium]|nr:helix-turn-helix domain-containing protein [Actinomycetes bacterium]